MRVFRTVFKHCLSQRHQHERFLQLIHAYAWFSFSRFLINNSQKLLYVAITEILNTAIRGFHMFLAILFLAATAFACEDGEGMVQHCFREQNVSLEHLEMFGHEIYHGSGEKVRADCDILEKIRDCLGDCLHDDEDITVCSLKLFASRATPLIRYTSWL